MPDPKQEMTEEPDGLTRLGTYGNAGQAHQRGLVVLSQGEPYWVQGREDGQVDLLVRTSEADWLAGQLELYERESVNWPPVNPEMPDETTGGKAVLAWLISLMLAYFAQSKWPALLDWGMLVSEKVQSGELYRAVTALFLHADAGHLSGNLLFGSVFVYLVARQSGNILALLTIFTAGILGNVLNAWLNVGTLHHSIGASTAVFGAIGILVTTRTGYVLRHFRDRLADVWVLPFVAGWTMLAWFGTGSELTDTTAHLMGFACGLPLGLCLGMLRPAGDDPEGEAA